MMYNSMEIGKTIKKERKALKYSQDDLAAWITTHCYRSCNRTTLWKWEHGRDYPPLDTMLKLCELFECDLGHLLGEYDPKTRPEVDIAKETGLSPQAVNKIMNTHSLYMVQGLDKLLSDDNFIELLEGIGVYIDLENLYQEQRQQTIDSGADKETKSMHDIRFECEMIEYNLDTQFRNILGSISNIRPISETMEYNLNTQFRNVLKDLPKSPSPEQAD